ncbi:TIGR01244 family sulfur transferase [Halomonas vilamensis]|uniref:TIGR01244 family sulfur transferase n=1 Tax=Vreelandella vilamensis TaxID=531309 RepID=A0ABU1H315_9GAMM|nr:TIGR01244 family sulfur transferase [Halomonas vilamensis]MDR5898685.1 TIGR01244 family sulfur transferase [Halomonas vilamensis]
MNIHELEPGFAISEAITPEDLEEVAQRGYKSVICNRRPGEAEDHPDDARLSEKAKSLGLEWRCIPVTPGEYSDADIAAFSRALDELPTPILAFCRSGKRSVHLWAHAKCQGKRCDIPALLNAAREAGHDLEDRRSALEAAQDTSS